MATSRPRVSFSIPGGRGRETRDAAPSTNPVTTGHSLVPGAQNGSYVRGAPSPYAAARRGSATAASPSRARVQSRRASYAGGAGGGPGAASVARADLPPARTSGLFWSDVVANAQAMTNGDGRLPILAAPRPELGTTSTQLVLRPSLHKRSVMVIGITDSDYVLNDIADVLRCAGACGPIRGAFRFPHLPPPGIQRPAYTSAVLLITFNEEEAAARAIQSLNAHIFSDGKRVSARLSTDFALSDDAAAKCLETFARFPSRSDTVTYDPKYNAWSCSDRLWAVLLSSQSPYEPDWDAARSAAERCEAVVINEGGVYLSCEAVEKPTGRRRSAGGVKRSRSEDRASSSHSVMRQGSAEGPETVQQQFYTQKYGKLNYRVGDDSSFLTRSWRQLTQFVSGSDGGDAAYMQPRQTHSESRSRSGEASLDITDSDASREQAPAVRRRRLEEGTEAQVRRALDAPEVRRATGPGATRRMNWLGEAMSWVPGLQHVAGLLRRSHVSHDDRANATRMEDVSEAGRQYRVSDRSGEPDLSADTRAAREVGGSRGGGDGRGRRTHYAFIPESIDPAQPPVRTMEQVQPLDEHALRSHFAPPTTGSRFGASLRVTAAPGSSTPTAPPTGLQLGTYTGASRRALLTLGATSSADDGYAQLGGAGLGRREGLARVSSSASAPAHSPREAPERVTVEGREVKMITTGPEPVWPRPAQRRQPQLVSARSAATPAPPAMEMSAPATAERARQPAVPLTPFGAARPPASQSSSTWNSRIQVLSINRSGDAPTDMSRSEIQAASMVPSLPSEQRSQRPKSFVSFAEN